MNDKTDSLIDRFWNSKNGIRYLIVTIVGMIAVSLLLTVAIIFFEPRYKDPPVDYTSDVYYPNKEFYCPGDIISFEIGVTITVDDPPLVIFVVDSFWDTDQNKTAVYGTDEKWTIVTETFSSTREIAIEAPNLPPGNYEYRRASSLYLSEPSVISVPFVISETCP